MRKNKLWEGRFSAAQDPLFVEFNDSLPFDWQLIEEDILGSMAYARALERAGIFKPSERRKVERALGGILEEHRKDPRKVRETGAEDVHTFVEQALSGKVGALALKLHTGRSRNDQVATDLRLYLRKRIREIDTDLHGLLETLAALAERHTAVILPGYTHLQRAQPVRFSHHMLAYAEMFLRDRQRLRETRSRLNVCPLGSGALSGTVYAVDRKRLAKDLGFRSPATNSMDAVSDRDFVLDFAYFAAALMMHLSRLSEDLILFVSSEFGLIRMDDRVSTGSSLMPQKKNPDALELIRGKAGRVFGHLVSLLATLKGLPMTYNKDLQEDKEALFDIVATVRGCVPVMRMVLETMTVDPERMREATAQGFLNATELADYLVEKGVPFREAHHVTGRIVTRAAELGHTLGEMSLKEYQSFSPHFDGDVYERLETEAGVERRREVGGTALAPVRRAIRSLRRRMQLPPLPEEPATAHDRA